MVFSCGLLSHQLEDPSKEYLFVFLKRCLLKIHFRSPLSCVWIGPVLAIGSRHDGCHLHPSSLSLPVPDPEWYRCQMCGALQAADAAQDAANTFLKQNKRKQEMK